MCLWTIQDIPIYEMLTANGVAFSSQRSFIGQDYPWTYDWMVQQMCQRIGQPPRPEITTPMWAWFQYRSRKMRKPPKSPSLMNSERDAQVFLEIEIPDCDVLLSDFSGWHTVIYGQPLVRARRLEKQIRAVNTDDDVPPQFSDYPLSLQQAVAKTWEGIFNIHMQDRWSMPHRLCNKSIQATFWMLSMENVISAELLERKASGNVKSSWLIKPDKTR